MSAIWEKLTDPLGLRQGEVLSGLHRSTLSIEALAKGEIVVSRTILDFAIIVTQDCDLDQDARKRQEGQGSDSPLLDVLLLEAFPVETFRSRLTPGSETWKRVKQNKNERYHVLECAPAEIDPTGIELPHLGLDFKRYFSMPVEELYFRVKEGTAQRRARLRTPYVEHLALRFAFFSCRVALPAEHTVTI